MAMDDNINSIRRFLHEFKASNVEENIKYRSSIISSYYLNPEDVKAEALDWSLHFLEQKKCPYSLALILAKLVAHQLSDSIYEMSLQAEEGIDEDEKRFRYESLQLYAEMTECLSEAIMNWQDHVDPSAVKVEPLSCIVSSAAIKNTRRKMEDRHVVIHDLNVVCGLKDAPRNSYYAIFDGHAGIEAASYCAAHLHWNIASHPEFLSNTEKAIYEAVILTDRNFLERSYREGIKGGCTVLCCLIRDGIMYIAWVGDSQAVLVKQGTPVPIGLPHKPDREDERCRIEELGGCVFFMGTWRVNGTLSVSRALGDAEHKPYISNEPEVLKIPLDGTEDYVVLACDGLWDQLQPSDVGKVVYNHIIENGENVDEVASKLVQLSKSQGSTDNITAIVVFLSDPLHINKPDQVFSQLQNNENHSQINKTNSTDFAANGISSTEQLNNELNSLNFSQGNAELEILSNFQEKAETLVQQSCVSNSLACEECLLPNYSNKDTDFSKQQSTMSSTVNHVANPLDCREDMLADEKPQENVNQNLIEGLSPIFTNCLDPSNICIENVGKVESNSGNLWKEIQICNTASSEKKESTVANDSNSPKENSEPQERLVVQSTADLEIESTMPLSEPSKDKGHLIKGREGAVFENNDHINLRNDSSSYYMSPDTSSSNFIGSIGYKQCTETQNVNNLATNYASQTEVEDLSTGIPCSINVETYQQKVIPPPLVNDELDFPTSDADILINNNNFHSSHNQLKITKDTIKEETTVNSADSLGHDESIILELSLPVDPVTDSLQAENKISDVILNDNLLVCKSAVNSVKESAIEIESTKSKDCTHAEAIDSSTETTDLAGNISLQSETKTHESVCAKVSFLENKQLKEGIISSTNFSEEGSAGSPDFNKTEPIQPPSQDNIASPVSDTNTDLNSAMLNASVENDSCLLYCVDKSVSVKQKLALQVAPEIYTETSNDVVNQQNSVNKPHPKSHISECSVNDEASPYSTSIIEQKGTDPSESSKLMTEQNLTENRSSKNSCENKESKRLNLEGMTCTERSVSKESLDEVLSKAGHGKEQKCNQENIPVVENPVISDKASGLQICSGCVPHTATNKAQAKYPLRDTKELSKFTIRNKSIATKKTSTKESASLPSNIQNKKQVTQTAAKDFPTKLMQKPKIKQMMTSKDEVQSTETKSTVATKPKSTQLSVFERLSTPKFTRSKEKEREDHSIKGSRKISAKPISESKARSNFSQSNKDLGAASEKVNVQSDNVKTSHSSTITSHKINTKSLKLPSSTHRYESKAPLSGKLNDTKVSGRNLSHKANDKVSQEPNIPGSTRKSSNVREADDMKNSNNLTNKVETTKQKSSVSNKITGKELLSKSTGQSTAFRSTVSKQINSKPPNTVSSLQSFKKVPVRSTRMAIEKSSISSIVTKERKTSTNVQKREPNSKTKTGKTSQVQKQGVSTHTKGNLVSLEGQGDCIDINTEVNGKNIASQN